MIDSSLQFQDGCQSTKTVIPASSGRQDLNITIVWPETNIGGLAVVTCPCGKTLQANRYCGGDFTNGAKWAEANVAACNFSDLAREICQLRNVSYQITYQSFLIIIGKQLF